MFTKQEIKRNLLGCLEVALFMPQARNRFGNTYEEALRSFIVPILAFPITLFFVYLYPKPELADASNNTIALLYSLKLAASWALFLGAVYLIISQFGRKEHFCQFVIANNWLSVPAAVVFLPVAWILISGGRTWEEIYPLLVCLMIYAYSFTAFMAACVLRIPWELAGFITMISFLINNYTSDVLTAVGSAL